ncbi:22212_t:CDS:2 [Entrophospora sp. SA101]|nr:22212_t:CDS:2 [Entrophospora sp. SA101]CAJ0862722.1 6924_t:CDS:2 [Entrophospora sp. SA101]CAJ0924037.1 3077_t:CDS:2 [Entrophospora sp. SA101]CAJ0924050.1 3083_t:CDS:2 [Entrophospora sp. SA101]
MSLRHENGAQYPVIDLDPHFTRVVRYFRPSDYLAWGAATAFGPAFMIMMEKTNPQFPSKGLNIGLRYAAGFGAMAGFLLAYQRSSFRFWGWEENSKEFERDKQEMTKRLREGKALYGNSELSQYNQKAAAWNSRYAALKFAAIPWFNFANHNYHDVDVSRY